MRPAARDRGLQRATQLARTLSRFALAGTNSRRKSVPAGIKCEKGRATRAAQRLVQQAVIRDGGSTARLPSELMAVFSTELTGFGMPW